MMKAEESYGIAGSKRSEGLDRSTLAGLGLASASLTAYLDFTLGVKSTFFGELAGTGRLLICFGGLAGAASGTLRGDRRIDFKLSSVGRRDGWVSFAGLVKFFDGPD